MITKIIEEGESQRGSLTCVTEVDNDELEGRPCHPILLSFPLLLTNRLNLADHMQRDRDG